MHALSLSIPRVNEDGVFNDGEILQINSEVLLWVPKQKECQWFRQKYLRLGGEDTGD